jgi:peptidoglycan/LPS O-acetylase OafA/YrhL
MATAQPRRSYRTVDGLRGIGAFLVVMRHVPDFFAYTKVPESFLAVDLFYLVSGFVVAHAYEERLRAGGFAGRFFFTRLIRLYPLYILGLALGFPTAVIAVIHPGGWWTPAKLAEAVAAGLFMIPFFPGLSANGSSLDGPTWTLLPELIANMVYALAIRFMNIAVLCAIILVSGAGVVFAEFHYHTLDVGYNPTDQWSALARVGFSFFVGVLLFRLLDNREQRSELVAWICMALLALALAFRPAAAFTPWFELGVVLFGFPALLVVASRFEPGALTGRVFSFIGLISYGIYILHEPIGWLLRAGLESLDWFPEHPNGWLWGTGFLLVLTGLAWQADRRYDGPVRRALNARFMAKRE